MPQQQELWGDLPFDALPKGIAGFMFNLITYCPQQDRPAIISQLQQWLKAEGVLQDNKEGELDEKTCIACHNVIKYKNGHQAALNSLGAWFLTNSLNGVRYRVSQFMVTEAGYNDPRQAVPVEVSFARDSYGEPLSTLKDK